MRYTRSEVNRLPVSGNKRTSCRNLNSKMYTHSRTRAWNPAARLCKTSRVSVRYPYLSLRRSPYEQLRVILQTTDDLINSATKAVLDGASIAAAVLNDRIVSCRLTRLVRPISAFAFKRRVASPITGTREVSHRTRMLLSSLCLSLSLLLYRALRKTTRFYNYCLTKKYPHPRGTSHDEFSCAPR